MKPTLLNLDLGLDMHMTRNFFVMLCNPNFTWYRSLWGSSLASKIDFQVLFASSYNSFMDLISHEVVKSKEGEVKRLIIRLGSLIL